MFVEDENIHSAASFAELRKECFNLVQSNFHYDSQYPNVAILAKEYKSKMYTMDLKDVAQIMHTNPISFIKEVRRRFETMSLIEAKRMQEGYWAWLDRKDGKL